MAMEQQTQSQNLADMADKRQRSFLHKFAEIVKESIRWDDLLICLASISVVESLTLSIIGSFLVIYFWVSIICTFLCDILQISPTGWKERSVLRKLACVLKAAYFTCFDIFTNMRCECSVNWGKAKELYASMSRNGELEEKMCSWEKERTDLMKQLSESREEIRGYEKRSSEMETLAMNLKKALESAEARERKMAHEGLNREEQLRVLWKKSTGQRDMLKNQLDESKLQIERLCKKLSALRSSRLISSREARDRLRVGW